jgi:LysM repeat protein
MAGKHAKPSKGGTFRRNIAVASTIAVGGLAIPATFAGTAHAADLDCKDIGHQVTIVDGNDPNHLDADHDGVGCESYPGPATALDDSSTPATSDAATAPAESAPADYIVKRGDNMSAIAAKFGVSLAALEKLNPGVIAGDRPDDYSLIFAGGHVHLPVGAHAGKHARASHVHVWYASCDDAPAGLHRGQAGYRHALDMDGDGKACEGPWPPASSGDGGTSAGSTGDGSGSTDGGSSTTPPAQNSDGTYTPVIAPDSPGTASGYAAHSPSFWVPLIQQAMSIVGGNVGANQDVNGVVALITSESGGDPNAINNYDSNAQNGDPSRGLMQTISATFNAYHESGTSTNIYDPLANICAALNYINAVYGGNIPSSPY